jgi:purine-binding chemotaxis protein CheW
MDIPSKVFLIVKAWGQLCAIPVRDVVETMRPLPTQALTPGIEGLDGVTVVRGRPVPVVHLGSVIGGAGENTPQRYVTVRAGERVVVLAVDEVLGLRELNETQYAEMPPLLSRGRSDAIAHIGVADSELLALLDAGRLVSPEAWRQYEQETKA